MSIYINKNTKVITQGITGKTGQFHTEKCIEYANGKNCFVAGVNPKKAGEKIFDVPIFASVKEAAQNTGATVSVIYVPPAGAAAAIWEAVEADLDLAICITEGIPVKDMLEVRNKMKAKEAKGGKKTLLLGPNCPGLITPDEIKIGIMPGHIHRKGRIGVVSRSGTLTYEAVAMLTEVGLGQSSAVGIGGDPINGLKHIDVMKAFNDDPNTDAVIMIGEIGGPDEADAAQWCKDWYGSDYYQSGNDRNPMGPATGIQRVLRGSAWSGFNPAYFRCANRFLQKPDYRFYFLGFRSNLLQSSSLVFCEHNTLLRFLDYIR